MENSSEDPKNNLGAPEASPEESDEGGSGTGTRIGIAVVVLVALGVGYWMMNRPDVAASAPAVPASAPAVQSPNDAVIIAEAAVKHEPTPENYLNLSLAYDRAGRHGDTIAAAKEALKLRPNYVQAWNNVCAGYSGLGLWDEAIAAAQEALRIQPDFQLAKNNLAWAVQMKAKAAKK